MYAAMLLAILSSSGPCDCPACAAGCTERPQQMMYQHRVSPAPPRIWEQSHTAQAKPNYPLWASKKASPAPPRSGSVRWCSNKTQDRSILSHSPAHRLHHKHAPQPHVLHQHSPSPHAPPHSCGCETCTPGCTDRPMMMRPLPPSDYGFSHTPPCGCGQYGPSCAGPPAPSRHARPYIAPPPSPCQCNTCKPRRATHSTNHCVTYSTRGFAGASWALSQASRCHNAPLFGSHHGRCRDACPPTTMHTIHAPHSANLYYYRRPYNWFHIRDHLLSPRASSRQPYAPLQIHISDGGF